MKTSMMYLLQEAEDYLTGAAVTFPVLSQKLLLCGSEEFRKLAGLMDSLLVLNNLLAIAGFEAGFDWNLKEINGRTARAVINDLNESHDEMITALTNKDFMLLADLLKEVLPLKLLAYRQLCTMIRQKLLAGLTVEKTQEVIM